MHSLLLLPVLSLPLACLAQAPAPAAGCPPVHVIASRATGEPPGEGIIGSLANDIQQMVPGTTSEALNYPATMPYSGSIPVGVTNLMAAIANNTAACPSTKLVLMGYSQGAAVTVDTLCGGGGADIMAPATPGLMAQEGSNVIAAVMMGDPRFVPGVSYEAGTNKVSPGVGEYTPFRLSVSHIESIGCRTRSNSSAMSNFRIKDDFFLRYKRLTMRQWKQLRSSRDLFGQVHSAGYYFHHV